MKVAVFGSRTLKDERVKILILEVIKAQGATMLVTTQEPAGVCEVCQAVAKELAIPLELHFLNFKFLRGAFEKRSRAVVRSADFFLLVHDGTSPGTRNELVLVKQSKKPFRYEILEPSPYDKSVGFNIKKDWTLGPEPKSKEKKSGWDQFSDEE
jgi:hypothetical protein